MNERIKELALQASDSIPDDVSAEHAMYLFQKKFAELIMQEMHRKVIASILITDVLMEEEGLIPTSEDYIQAINKDFGVM
jgi:hypothetical protein